MHNLVEESADLSAVVLGLFAAISLLAHRHDRWAAGFRRRWLGVLLIIAAAVVLVQVSEEVLGQESTAIDRSILLAIHAAVPAGLLPLFNAATQSGSSHVLVPAVAVAVLLLLWRRHRFEALQLATVTAVAGVVVYVAKTAVGRARPDLWSTQWFWGSSFPSGHTLSTAAVATAACLAVARLRPSIRVPAMVLAVVWVALVGVSRLVLGVHWPTDVVAAACAGLLVATGVNGVLTFIAHRTRRTAGTALPTTSTDSPR
ncbi:phosphatase PAP2 family protein [Cognatilysobacter terrigena]|uniref:phosphatase PAP2 family protein n=1 Tax=Cognatilysobacter terrigena TaxID=2488749 RepID=UPI00106209AB|nr:phosphatase PAP2 family protein [Lysobacter terrigena]